MNIQALSPKVAGLFGYGVMLVDGYEQELSPVERDNENRMRIKNIKIKKTGPLKIELKALEMLGHMPEKFTVPDLNKKNQELKIFPHENIGYITKYFYSAVTIKRHRNKITRDLITTYTKVNP